MSVIRSACDVHGMSTRDIEATFADVDERHGDRSRTIRWWNRARSVCRTIPRCFVSETSASEELLYLELDGDGFLRYTREQRTEPRAHPRCHRPLLMGQVLIHIGVGTGESLRELEGFWTGDGGSVA